MLKLLDSGRLPIQAPILNRLGDMLFMNGGAAVKISNGAGYFEDAGIGSGRETEAVGDEFQHAVAGGIEFAVLFDVAGCHLGVAVDFSAFIALQLDFSRTCHSLGDLSAELSESFRSTRSRYLTAGTSI